MEELKRIVEEINQIAESLKAENEKNVEKGIKAAGKRARKISVELGKKLKLFREISITANK